MAKTVESAPEAQQYRLGPEAGAAFMEVEGQLQQAAQAANARKEALLIGAGVPREAREGGQATLEDGVVVVTYTPRPKDAS